MKIIYYILISFLIFSCEGVLWDGVPRTAASDTVNITIIIDCPEFELWQDYYNGET